MAAPSSSADLSPSSLARSSPSTSDSPLRARSTSVSTISSLIGVETSKGSHEMTGNRRPAISSWRASGRRSISSPGLRSTTRRSGKGPALGKALMPRPRTSKDPLIDAGASTTSSPSSTLSSLWSSLTSDHPRSIKRKARSDFPAPDAPRSSTAAPWRATVVAWISSPVIPPYSITGESVSPYPSTGRAPEAWGHPSPRAA